MPFLGRTWMFSAEQLFDTLIELVTNIGKIENESRDVENQTKQLQVRVTTDNLRRVLSDMNDIKRENEALRKRMK